MNATLFKVVLVLLFLVVLYNLGQALYFMMTDRGSTGRTAWALTRRIGLSLLLIALILLGIWMGWIHPHGVGG